MLELNWSYNLIQGNAVCVCAHSLATALFSNLVLKYFVLVWALASQKGKAPKPGTLTILVNTIVSTNDNTLVNLLPIFVTVLLLHSATVIFWRSSMNKVNKMIILDKMAISLKFAVT